MALLRLRGGEGVNLAGVTLQLVMSQQLWEHAEADRVLVGPARCDLAQGDDQQGPEDCQYGMEAKAWQVLSQTEARDIAVSLCV